MSKKLTEKVLQQAQTPTWVGDIRNGLLLPINAANIESSFVAQASLGRVAGVSRVSIVGRVAELAINTEVTLWDQNTVYTYLPADTELFISSSNAGDNQTYSIQGMTDDYVLKTGTVTANGQTQASAGEYFRVFRITNLGSTNNTGNIYLAEFDTLTGGVPDTVSKIKGRIVAGQNVSRQAIYTVPAGKTFLVYLLSLQSQRAGDVEFSFMTRSEGSVFLSFFDLDVFESQLTFPLVLPFPVPEKTDMEIRSTSDANNIRASCAIGALLVDN